ncbi:hypothetical protein ACOCJ7_01820 [Knoellia sp. CPCC 206453]|uniref:hypothetical protein n=1 Tax=Knoellia pratensis TaxID=3404796 RepID=UPI0036131556
MSDPHRPGFSSSPVVELRQYTLRPGTRDTLVGVFEEHLVDGQEDCGMAIGSVCLDEADPDRFVWMRGFTNLEQRTEALGGFYLGPVWGKHRDVANGTMIDSDDVLMLRPTEPAHPPAQPRNDLGGPTDRIHLSVYTYAPDHVLDTHLSTDFHEELESLLGVPVDTWRSHCGPNGFPQLPVRDDHAFVWAATFADAEQRQEALQRFRDSGRRDDLLSHGSPVGIQELNLRPTRRSRHPHPNAPPL